MKTKQLAITLLTACLCLSATPASNETTWVGKGDNAKSCATEKGVSLETAANELQKADVKVLKKRKIHDGKMRIQMCGADKGTMNGFLILKKDLEKAKNLGFSAVPTPLDIKR